MTLVGMGIGTHGRTREGLPISITYGIGIAFLYFIAFSFCSSLGNAGMLPPLVAVWIVNFVALSLVTILILNID
jgi:lipopolysaccharide export system permease protein